MNGEQLEFNILKKLAERIGRLWPDSSGHVLSPVPPPLEIDAPGFTEEQVTDVVRRLHEKGLIEVDILVNSKAEGEVWRPTRLTPIGWLYLKQNLEPSPRTARTPVQRAPGPKLKKFPTPAGTKWNEVVIRFISQTEVEVRAREKKRNFTFDEIGFQDRRRSGKVPSELWRTLSTLAANDGELSKEDLDLLYPTKKVNARDAEFKRIRHLLRRMMDIDKTPIVKDASSKGYRAKFQTWHELRRARLQQDQKESIDRDVQQLIHEETQPRKGRRSYKAPSY